MSTIIHSSGYGLAKHEESANFCSGTGTTKNTPTNLLVGDLAAVDRIVSFTPPLASPVYKEHFGAMDGEFGTIVKEKTDVGEGNIVQWLQTKANADRIISGTIGTIPNSEDLHLEVGTTYFDMYGVLDKSLTFTLEGVGGKVLQTRDIFSTQLDETASNLVVPAQSVLAPVLAKDVEITVDGITYAALSIPNFTHVITPEHNIEHVLGSQYVLEPVLLGRMHEISFETNLKSTNTWFADLLNYTIQKFTIVITYGTVAQYTYTDMTPYEVREHDILGRGKIINKFGFKPTSTTSVTQDL